MRPALAQIFVWFLVISPKSSRVVPKTQGRGDIWSFLNAKNASKVDPKVGSLFLESPGIGYYPRSKLVYEGIVVFHNIPLTL